VDDQCHSLGGLEAAAELIALPKTPREEYNRSAPGNGRHVTVADRKSGVRRPGGSLCEFRLLFGLLVGAATAAALVLRQMRRSRRNVSGTISMARSDRLVF
jgi:hypothetical protein